jgi:hypothetical protein
MSEEEEGEGEVSGVEAFEAFEPEGEPLVEEAEPAADPDAEGNPQGPTPKERLQTLGEGVNWRRLATLTGLATLVVLAGIGWVYAAQQVGVLFVSIVTVGFVAGLVILPAFWLLLGRDILPRGMRGAATRILWTIASIIHGPYVMYYRDDATVDMVPADPEANEIYVDGEWRGVEDDANWSRLGKTTFGVTWQKSDKALQDINRGDDELTADGGEYTLYGQDGGHYIGSQLVGDIAGRVINYKTLAERLRGAAGASIADAAKREGLIDHGGAEQIGTKWLVIGIISCLVLGSITGAFAFGYI